MPADATVDVDGGRVIGVHDFGPSTGTPVLWSHGGPGSRLEPMWLVEEATAAGFRIVGVDRPGYGLSTPKPGRTILDGVDDLVRVADALSLPRFASVGVSTGGVYALACAVAAPERVLGVVACGAMTDMAWAPGRATMHGPQVHAIWDAPDRVAALVAATDAYGDGFRKLLDGGMNPVLAASDAALFADPAWMRPAMEGFAAMSAFGLEGYVDDRIADGSGWNDVDIASITRPVTILHGDEDRLVDVVHARHTAEIVPTATLVVVPGAGHFSIERHVVATLADLADRA